MPSASFRYGDGGRPPVETPTDGSLRWMVSTNHVSRGSYASTQRANDAAELCGPNMCHGCSGSSIVESSAQKRLAASALSVREGGSRSAAPVAAAALRNERRERFMAPPRGGATPPSYHSIRDSGGSLSHAAVVRESGDLVQ